MKIYPLNLAVEGSFTSLHSRRICIWNITASHMEMVIALKHELRRFQYTFAEENRKKNEAKQIFVNENTQTFTLANYACEGPPITDILATSTPNELYVVDNTGVVHRHRLEPHRENDIENGMSKSAPGTTVVVQHTPIHPHELDIPNLHCGLGLTSENEIVVSHQLRRKLFTFTSEGSLIREIELQGYPSAITTISSSPYLIASAEKSDIVIYDLRCNPKNSLGQCVVRARCGANPHLSLCEGPEHMVFAAGRSRAISCLDLRTRQVKNILKKVTRFGTNMIHWERDSGYKSDPTQEICSGPSVKPEIVSSPDSPFQGSVVVSGTDSEVCMLSLGPYGENHTLQGDDIWIGVPVVRRKYFAGITLKGSIAVCDFN